MGLIGKKDIAQLDRIAFGYPKRWLETHVVLTQKGYRLHGTCVVVDNLLRFSRDGKIQTFLCSDLHK
jgi:hypothetical protein